MAARCKLPFALHLGISQERMAPGPLASTLLSSSRSRSPELSFRHLAPRVFLTRTSFPTSVVERNSSTAWLHAPSARRSRSLNRLFPLPVANCCGAYTQELVPYSALPSVRIVVIFTFIKFVFFIDFVNFAKIVCAYHYVNWLHGDPSISDPRRSSWSEAVVIRSSGSFFFFFNTRKRPCVIMASQGFHQTPKLAISWALENQNTLANRKGPGKP